MFEAIKEEDTTRWKIYSLTVIGILVLISIIWLVKIDIGYKKYTGNNSQGKPSNIVEPNVVQANPGEVVDGFPENLILNSKNTIVQSYSATYPNTLIKQETVIFTSLKNTKTNYNFYLDWSKQNGWSVLNASEGDDVSLLYLRKGAEDINITITKEYVTISHINK